MFVEKGISAWYTIQARVTYIHVLILKISTDNQNILQLISFNFKTYGLLKFQYLCWALFQLYLVSKLIFMIIYVNYHQSYINLPTGYTYIY